MSHKDVIKKTSMKTVVVSSLILIAGIVLLFVSFDYSKLLGSMCIIIGLCSLFFSKKEEIYVPTGSRMLNQNFYYNPQESSKIKIIFENKNFPALKAMAQVPHGSLLETHISKDHRFATAQLFLYVPHRYEEASPLYEFHEEDAENLANTLIN